MSDNFIAQFGDKLVAGGFPILPIVPGKKYPGQYQQGRWFPYKGWMKHASRATTEHELAIWKQWPEAGIGIAGGVVVGIDIDVDDESLANQLEDLARTLFGPTPAVRIGRAPKRLLVYQAEAPFKGIKSHPLEVLCRGQQFVAFAIHPDTGEPYHWPEVSLTDLTLADLPVITEAQARSFIEQGIALLPESMRPARLGTQAQSSSTILSQPVLPIGDLRGTMEAVSDALRYIVNADLPYDDWVRIGMAIKGALGEDGSGLFAEWSASSSKNVSEVTARAWDSFRPTAIGAGTIYHLAQKNGWSPNPAIVMNPVNLASGPHPASEMLRDISDNYHNYHHYNDDNYISRELIQLQGGEFDTSNLDGIMKMLVDYTLETSTRPQPVLAVGNAICALGALIGRRFRTESDVRSNIYIIGIADSGSGKNHSREVITNLFITAELDKYLGGNRIASGAGLLRAVFDHPAILFQQDEFGMFLQAAADRKRSPKYITDILDLMTELYSSSGTTFLGPEYALQDDKHKRKDIQQPCLCMYGTTTPLLFWSALKSANITDGSLARFLIFRVQEDYPESNKKNLLLPLPGELVDAVKILSECGSMGGNLSGHTKGPETKIEPRVVPMNPEAKGLFGTLNVEMTQLLRQVSGSRYSPILARVWENSAKIALIRAASFDPINPVIRGVDAAWAIAAVKDSVNKLIVDVERHVADNQTEQNHKQMLEVIRAAGPAGITLGGLAQDARFLDRRPRMEVLQTLVESGQVEMFTRRSRTRPATVYRIRR
ncbi:MAG: PriCT-2 domain-containing protein [Magnetococcales bacterium]|nr:PriCT-2 domain-containing protein [Magnetococcales bacterium]